MAELEPTFLDTSVLLPGLIDFGPSADSAQRIMTAIADLRLSTPHTAWHCCLEFFSVSTRLPAEVRLSVADATRLVLEETDNVRHFGILVRHGVRVLRTREFAAAVGL